MYKPIVIITAFLLFVFTAATVWSANSTPDLVILYTGDNGFEKGIKSKSNGITVTGRKHTVCNVATRVPLIAYWPGKVPEGKTVTDMVEFADFLPTLYSLGGGTLFDGAKVDGRSFANQILTGENTGGDDWKYALAE